MLLLFSDFWVFLAFRKSSIDITTPTYSITKSPCLRSSKQRRPRPRLEVLKISTLASSIRWNLWLVHSSPHGHFSALHSTNTILKSSHQAQQQREEKKTDLFMQLSPQPGTPLILKQAQVGISLTSDFSISYSSTQTKRIINKTCLSEYFPKYFGRCEYKRRFLDVAEVFRRWI